MMSTQRAEHFRQYLDCCERRAEALRKAKESEAADGPAYWTRTAEEWHKFARYWLERLFPRE